MWDETASNWVDRGREAWALEEPVWFGRGNPESEIHLLPDVSGLDAIELGCGTAYVSSWLMRRGARVVGLDNSSRQLATAQTFQEEFSLHFPLVHADAERTPFADESFDFAISQYGAAVWCDPYRWIPEASRILRPGGRLVFESDSPLVMLCYPTDDEDAPADTQLRRDYFGMHRFEWHDDKGVVEAVDFHLGHGDMIRLLRSCGFEIEDLIELQPPPDVALDMDYIPLEWARRWPCAEIWKVRRVGQRPRATPGRSTYTEPCSALDAFEALYRVTSPGAQGLPRAVVRGARRIEEGPRHALDRSRTYHREV
jgi:SAM-dependent methyltransferase